ncbi:MAG: hypothetical protein QM500_01140 [Methylococcales bacterium]
MKLSINGSVGDKGANHLKDVKIVQALLNVFLRRECRKILVVDGKNGTNTITAITYFQTHEVKLSKPDGNVGANGRTFRTLKASLSGVLKDGLALIMPNIGIVTFNSEGMEGGFYHSRILHVPGAWSGLTIGRGYDMKTKSGSKIQNELVKAGVSVYDAKVLSGANGLSGAAAKQYIIDKDLLDFQVTPVAQKELFLISYADIEKYIQGVYTRNVKKITNATVWASLDNRIKEIVVDLAFRGDYTKRSRKFLLGPIADNDFTAFKAEMVNQSNWTNVPADRFKRRKDFL